MQLQHANSKILIIFFHWFEIDYSIECWFQPISFPDYSISIMSSNLEECSKEGERGKWDHLEPFGTACWWQMRDDALICSEQIKFLIFLCGSRFPSIWSSFTSYQDWLNPWDKFGTEADWKLSLADSMQKSMGYSTVKRDQGQFFSVCCETVEALVRISLVSLLCYDSSSIHLSIYLSDPLIQETPVKAN